MRIIMTLNKNSQDTVDSIPGDLVRYDYGYSDARATLFISLSFRGGDSAVLNMIVLRSRMIGSFVLMGNDYQSMKKWSPVFP